MNTSTVAKLVVAAFVLLLGAGPAPVWANAVGCCASDHHDTAVRVGDTCLTPACCVASAPVPSRQSGQQQLDAVTSNRTPFLEVPHLAPRSTPHGSPAPPTSARAQTSPVLRR